MKSLSCWVMGIGNRVCYMMLDRWVMGIRECGMLNDDDGEQLGNGYWEMRFVI